MKNYHIQNRLLTGLFFLYAVSICGQLNASGVQLWQKVKENSRIAAQCSDENILNFHCGLQEIQLNDYIRHSKNKSHTLTVVYASKENEVIWYNDSEKITLANNQFKKAYKDKNIELKKKPSFFSFASNGDPKASGRDSLNIQLANKNVYEMIFMPRKANTGELNKIHSYLSIKYGISLEKGKYYASDGKVIWDPEMHKEYPFRVTGIGRDENNELYQKESSNQEDSFLAIGLNDIKRTNAENTSSIDNYNFVIWSDDNKAMSLKNEGNFNILERNWEINFIGNTIPKDNYQVRIDKEKINPRALPVEYWMFVKKGNGETLKITGKEENDYIIFSKVEFMNAFDSGSNTYFTFGTSPLKNHKGKDDGIQPLAGVKASDNDVSSMINMINLYPNPVKKDQNFTLTFPSMEDLSISVYDAGGRLIILDKVDRNARSYANHMASQGSYLVILTRNGKILKTFKLIVD